MSPSINFSSQRFDAAVSFRNSGLSDPMERLLPFSDVHKKNTLGTKEKKDWRDMSGEEWDKMLGGVDAYIDAFKEKLRDMKKLQEEAVREAVLEAEPGLKTIAASAAALAVANGFDSATKVSADVTTELKVEEKLEK